MEAAKAGNHDELEPPQADSHPLTDIEIHEFREVLRDRPAYGRPRSVAINAFCVSRIKADLDDSKRGDAG